MDEDDEGGASFLDVLLGLSDLDGFRELHRAYNDYVEYQQSQGNLTETQYRLLIERDLEGIRKELKREQQEFFMPICILF